MPMRLPASLETFGSTYSPVAPPRASTWKLSEVPILLLPFALAPGMKLIYS